MKVKGKRLVILVLVFLVSIGSFLTMSTTDTIIPTPVVKADRLGDASNLCLLLHTYMEPVNGDRVDWGGFIRCVGDIMGWG